MKRGLLCVHERRVSKHLLIQHYLILRRSVQYTEKLGFRFLHIGREVYIRSYLKRERQRQLQFRLGYGKAYIRLYADSEGYINTDGNGNEIQMVTVRCDGSYIQPRVMQHCSKVIHQELGCPAFDFHSLRHPYVKHTTKIFSLRLKFFQAQPVPDAL